MKTKILNEMNEDSKRFIKEMIFDCTYEEMVDTIYSLYCGTAKDNGIVLEDYVKLVDINEFIYYLYEEYKHYQL